jgi:hypothetical protein
VCHATTPLRTTETRTRGAGYPEGAAASARMPWRTRRSSALDGCPAPRRTMSCRACVITSPAGSSEVSFAPGAIVRHAPAPPHAIAPVDRARLGVRSVDCTFVAGDTGDLECGARRLSAAPDRSLKNVLNDPSPITLKLCKGTGQKEPRRRARRWMRKRLLTSSADAWHLQLLSCAKALVPRRSTLGHR